MGLLQKSCYNNGENVDEALMNLIPPHPDPLPKRGEGMSFPLPSGERTKVRGRQKLLKQDLRQVIRGHPLTKNSSH